MKTPPHVIIILGFNSKSYLKTCITLALGQSIPVKVVFVDNNSSDGSCEYVAKAFPEVTVRMNTRNLGYAAAYNKALKECFAEGYIFCLLINPDLFLEPDTYERLLDTFRSHPRCGLVQPSILLHHTRKINSLGNAIHYLGYGYCPDVGKSYHRLDTDKQTSSASGAAVLISHTYFQNVGGFNESFFMYGEDQDLSWRGLLQGYVHYVSAKALAYHEYDFSRNKTKWYHSEKNRMMMVLQNYSFRTLAILFPALIVQEFLSLCFHIAKGTIRDLLKAYVFMFRNSASLRKNRIEIQKRRSVKDSIILSSFQSAIISPLFDSPPLRFVINPFYRGWYRVVQLVISV